MLNNYYFKDYLLLNPVIILILLPYLGLTKIAQPPPTIVEQGVALTGRNTTGTPCCVTVVL